MHLYQQNICAKINIAITKFFYNFFKDKFLFKYTFFYEISDKIFLISFLYYRWHRSHPVITNFHLSNIHLSHTFYYTYAQLIIIYTLLKHAWDAITASLFWN